MHRAKIVILIFLLLIGMSSSPVTDNPDKIIIAIASSLSLPMKQIKKQFEKQHNARVDLVAASSGVLTAQIIHGAPFDIFISANLRYPQKLYDIEITPSSPQTFIWGSLAFWSKDSLSGRSPQDVLRETNIQTVAVANPELAPFGEAAVSWLKKRNTYQKTYHKLVYGESIGNVNQFILSGSIDAAFTSVSALHSSQLAKQGYWEVLSQSGNQDIPHAAVLLRYTNLGENSLYWSRLFMKYLFSSEAQSVFRKFGYIPAKLQKAG